MKRYYFSVERLYGDLTAEVAAKELEKIQKKKGKILPEYVVEEAENENSPLHDVFEWDDTVAASRFRIQQARDLIRNIQVEIVTKKVNCDIRAFVNVKTQDDERRSYQPIKKAIADDTAYQDLLAQAKREMESFVTTYSQITELNDVKVEMLKALARLK